MISSHSSLSSNQSQFSKIQLPISSPSNCNAFMFPKLSFDNFFPWKETKHRDDSLGRGETGESAVCGRMQHRAKNCIGIGKEQTLLCSVASQSRAIDRVAIMTLLFSLWIDIGHPCGPNTLFRGRKNVHVQERSLISMRRQIISRVACCCDHRVPTPNVFFWGNFNSFISKERIGEFIDSCWPTNLAFNNYAIGNGVSNFIFWFKLSYTHVI